MLVFDRNLRQVGWGVFLILIGVVYLLEWHGVLPRWAAHGWWPLIVIGLGVVQTVGADRARKLGSGVTLTLLGVWFFAATNRWYGMDWGNSWPLALVAVGAGTVARAIAANWLPDQRWVRKEGPHA